MDTLRILLRLHDPSNYRRTRRLAEQPRILLQEHTVLQLNIEKDIPLAGVSGNGVRNSSATIDIVSALKVGGSIQSPDPLVTCVTRRRTGV
jgi:hypothetical protein